MPDTQTSEIQPMIANRYSNAPPIDVENAHLLSTMLARGSCRKFQDRPVSQNMLNLLCAAAMAAPTKSDLQQRDIVFLQSPRLRHKLANLVSGQAWVASAPLIVVFCGNNRRQRLLHSWSDVPFANDHLDAFFNAVGDAAIALGAFVTAAETMGLGCCPISAVRNEARAISDLLCLPDHVFPFAGLAIGYPVTSPEISMRLPLQVTCHVDQYDEKGLEGAISTYGARRAKEQPYAKQRFLDAFGTADPYTWSDDKVRQYSQPERENFGEYVRAQGFKLD